MKKLSLIPILTLLLLTGLLTPAVAQHKGQASRSSRAVLLQNLLSSVQGKFPESFLRIKKNNNGFVRHIGTDPGNYFPTKGNKDPDTRARIFLKQWKNLFHGKSDKSGYKTLKIKDKIDRSYVRLHQLYAELTVFGAQTIVQLDADMNVTYVNSDIMRDFTPLETGKLELRPTLSPVAAQNLAIDQVVASGNQAKTTEAELMIYCPTVVGTKGATQLVWQTIVEGLTGPSLKEMVLINAHTGTVAFRYSLIYDIKNREVYDSANTQDNPGTLIRTESDPESLITDVDQCYDYIGDTYDFYLDEHERDSIDNSGMTISGTVRYCDPDFGCPMANAYWYNSRIYFGDGFTAADDVIAHELTHGVTQNESRLIYAYQSGSINESFSDIWGEFVDLSNNSGTDTPDVRWQIGEDIPVIGTFRDMKDPTSFGDPDRILSPLYYCGDLDLGGVHTNSGVSNKLSYLLTDGDSFNGRTITGMGISKVADLYYECQTNLLNSSSNYSDLYSALTQAAINLGFNQAERDNVEMACQAVEIDEEVCYVEPPPNDECESGIIVEDNSTFTASTHGATGTDLSNCSINDTLDVWHNYTPSFSGEVTISTEASGFDTTLSIFDACGGTELACDDDSGSGLTSRIVIFMTAGQTYQIRIAGYNGGKGNYVLTVSIEGTDTDSDGVFDSVDNCPGICNPGQLDADDDNIGDVCDSAPGCGACGESACELFCDMDNDGIPDIYDNCPDSCNSQQLDYDNDTLGDVCDPEPGCGGCGAGPCESEC